MRYVVDVMGYRKMGHPCGQAGLVGHLVSKPRARSQIVKHYMLLIYNDNSGPSSESV
jgi:hypothetical protein